MRISDWSSDVCSSDLVRANWPGATAREVEQQVTDKIEKKLQETPFLNYVMSYSKPAESTVYVVLRDDTPPKQVPDIRSEEHTSELQSLMRISYAVFCLKKKKKQQDNKYLQHHT